MNSLNIFNRITFKLNERYKSLNFKSLGALYTVVFDSPVENYTNSHLPFHFDINEYPILECLLPNGNYFLMTTDKMISYFCKKFYLLSYKDYWWHDTETFKNNLPLTEGQTRVFKYLSQTKKEFIFEIESGLPAVATHNCILYEMRKIYPTNFNHDV